MKRKFLAKAITLGLMLAVPLGAQAATNYAPDVDGNNLTYKVSDGYIGTLDRLSLSNDANGNTIYNDSKVNNLSIIKDADNSDILISLWNNTLKINIDGTFKIEDTIHDNGVWQPTVHLDTSDTNKNIFNVKAKDIIVEGGSQIGFNIYSRNDYTKAEVNLEAQDSVKITAGGTAINLSDQKTNVINVAAGNNITIESDNNAMSIGKEANATLNAGGQINLKSNGSRSVLNNSGNVSVNSKIVNINSNSIAIDNKGTLNINQNYKGNINETTLNIYNVLNNNTDAGIIKASAGVISVISNCEGTVNTIISNYGNASLDLRATNSDIRVTSRKDQDSYYNSNYGIQANGNVNLNAENGKVIIDVYQRGLNAGTGGNVDIKAKEVDITSGTHAINAYGGSTVTIEAEKIYLNATNGIDPIYGNYDLGINVSSGSKVEFKNAKEVSVIGGISAKGTDDAGKVSSVDINASNKIYIEGTIKNVAEGTSSIPVTAGNINIGSDNQDTTINIDGNIYSGEFPGAIENIEGGNGVAKAEGGSINIVLNNENSSLNGNIYDKDAGQNENNGVHLEVNNGATWTTTGDSTVKEVKSNGGVIDLAGTDQKVDIKKITSDDTNKGTTIKTDSIDNKLTIGNNESKLDVVASGKVTDSIGNDIQGGMNKLLNNIDIKVGTKETTVKAEAGAVTGETTITRDKSGNTGAAVEKVNKDNAGISEMASIDGVQKIMI